MRSDCLRSLRTHRPPISCARAAVVRCRASAAVGIDLGTTSSAIALVLPGDSQPRILHDRLGKAIVPSVVVVRAVRAAAQSLLAAASSSREESKAARW